METYEDELLEIYSENKNNIINLAKTYGLSYTDDIELILSKLVGLKEYCLNKEFERSKLIQLEIEQDNKNIEQIIELNLKLNQYKRILNSFQSSYKKIKEFDVDGIEINALEYETLSIKPILFRNEEQEDVDGEPL